MAALVVLLVLLGGFALALVGIYNGLVTLRNQVRNAWQQIGVQLKRRHDLIPNLVEVVKDYMGYEQETLDKVIRARNQALGSRHAPPHRHWDASLTRGRAAARCSRAAATAVAEYSPAS